MTGSFGVHGEELNQNNMTELALFRYIHDNNIEWHWHENNGMDDVVIFPMFYQVEEFNSILSKSIFDDDGIECNMKDGYIAFWMNDICEYHGIDINQVFDGEDWN